MIADPELDGDVHLAHALITEFASNTLPIRFAIVILLRLLGLLAHRVNCEVVSIAHCSEMLR